MKNIVVTCVKSKAFDGETAKFGSLNPGSLEDVLAGWHELLALLDRCKEIQSLYKGRSWCEVLRAATLTCANFHVASAGLGLVKFGTRVPSYEASFSDSDDRVADKVRCEQSISEIHRQWWRRLGESTVQG